MAEETLPNPPELSTEKTLRIFLSYSHLDKVLAGQIKLFLEFYFGLDVFLAHDDLIPPQDWREVIIERIKSTDIFMPLLTENFKSSDFTDQESGMAHAYGKKIISLIVELNPYGFLEKYQAFKFDRSEVFESCESLLAVLIDGSPEYKENLTDCLLRALSRCSSWSAAAAEVGLLEKIKLDSEKISELINTYLLNENIHGSFQARPVFERIVKRASADLDTTLLEKFKEKVKENEQRLKEVKEQKKKEKEEIPF